MDVSLASSSVIVFTSLFTSVCRCVRVYESLSLCLSVSLSLSRYIYTYMYIYIYITLYIHYVYFLFLCCISLSLCICICIYIYIYPYYGAHSTTFYPRFSGPLPTRSRIAERPPSDAPWSRLGAVLGPSCARPGLPGGRLGAVLGPLWTSSGPSWGHLSALAAKKATLSKTCVFPRFWSLFELLRSIAAVKLGST